MYASLKTNYNIIKRDPTFHGHKTEHSLPAMRKAIVDWLVLEKKVIVKKHEDHILSLDDVHVSE